MGSLAGYVAAVAGVLAVVEAVLLALGWAATGRPPRLLGPLVGRLEAARARRRRPEPMPPVLLELELRRLGGEVQRVAASDLPAKAMRLRACTAAYDYVLLECCRSLDLAVPAVEPPAGLPLSSGQRFRAEASLLEAGFSW